MKRPQPRSPQPVKHLSGALPGSLWAVAMPWAACWWPCRGWKRDVREVLDRLISRAVPKATKAVKWSAPLYGLDRDTRLMGFRCTARYVKAAFFMGAHLYPMPPEASTQENVR